MILLTLVCGAVFDASPYLPLALALVWTLKFQKVADLSLAGSFSVAGACFVSALDAGVPLLASALLALAIGGLIGLVTSAVVNWLRIDGLLAGLLVLFVAYGVSLSITQGTITIPDSLNPLASVAKTELSLGIGQYYLLQSSALILSGSLLILMSGILLRSEWGCSYRALEDARGGRTLLRLLNRPPEGLSATGFALGGSLAAASGVLVALQAGQTTASMGIESLLEIIPAYLLGVGLFDGNRVTAPKTPVEAAALSSLNGNTAKERLDVRLPIDAAAPLGVVLYYLLVTFAHFFTPAPWLPRVLVGGLVALLLGARAVRTSFQDRKAERRATTLVPGGKDLQVSNLTVGVPWGAGTRTVLDSVGFEASRGELVQIAGPNGVGKTTLLRALLGVLRCEGRFRIPVDGTHRKSKTRRRFGSVGYVPQDATEASAGPLTVREHLFLTTSVGPLSPWRSWKRTDVPLGGLERDGWFLQNQRLDSLSGGQRRRVLLEVVARRADRYEVIALDEPFTDLDQQASLECQEAILQFQEQRRLVLLVDHSDRMRPDRVLSLDTPKLPNPQKAEGRDAREATSQTTP